MFAKEKPFRSRKYLAWIRQQPCVYCGERQDVQAHHLIGIGGLGVMGSKADDSLAMPLCPLCHGIMHKSPDWQGQQWEFITRTIQQAFREGVLHG